MTDSPNFPEHWKRTKLKDVGDIVSGGTPSTRNPVYWGSEVSWITPADLSGYTQKFISTGRKSLSRAGLQASSARLIPKGSVLFSSRAPIGYVAIAAQELATNQGFKNFVPYSGVDSSYAYYYLRHITKLAEKVASGTTFKEISGSKFADLPFLLPPSEEQVRIVAKIEELFSELDNAVESLKRAHSELRTYRQAVLKHAFEGRLGEKNVKGGELPDGWQKVRLGELGVLLSGQHILERDYNQDGKGIAYLTGPADFGSRYPLVSKWTEYPKAVASKHSVLITVKGAGVGKSNILNIESAAISRQLMAYSSDAFDYRYVFHYLVSRFHDFQQLGMGSTVPGLDRETVLNYRVPRCGIDEQERIVAEIEGRLSVCDNLEGVLATGLKQAEVLRQSILLSAFSGRLVEKSDRVEPVEALLERIGADREAFAKEVRTRRTRTKDGEQSVERRVEKVKTILELLTEYDGKPVATRSVWQSSNHKDDIDGFYAEVKALVDSRKVRETKRKGRESFLALVNSK